MWDLIQRVNVMSHVWAARHVLPHMLERGDGYLLNTASAAGLLTELHSAPYAVTKHAALAFAEWLSITYGDRGIKVAALCPEGVWTPMIQNAPLLQQTAITTDELVARTLEVLREGGFLITTHPSTLKGFQLKAADYDGWIGKMRHLRGKAMALLHVQQGGAEAGRRAVDRAGRRACPPRRGTATGGAAGGSAGPGARRRGRTGGVAVPRRLLEPHLPAAAGRAGVRAAPRRWGHSRRARTT